MSQGQTVDDLVKEAREKLSLPDIYWLLACALGKEKEFIFSHPEYIPAPDKLKKWSEYKTRRLEGEPSAYITGYREFFSLCFKVNRDTMIPRPETELLVEEVIRLKPKSLLDVGTGCGNIAVAIKYHIKNCRVIAVDLSKGALRVARENAIRLLGKHDIIFLESNYFDNLPEELFEVIVSNPPYVKSGQIYKLQKEIRDWEPIISLDGGTDGLDAYRIIIRQGKRFLAEGGWMVLEIDRSLLEGISTLVKENGYIIRKIARDFSGKDRMMVLEK